MKAMKRKLSLLIIVSILFASCADKIEETYLINEPVYLTYADMRSSLKSTDSEPIVQPGKIYFKDNYIFVNEYQEGIHIINNSDPANPVVVKFIEIPGNVDMAIKGNVLYADSYVDLVSIDISDLDNIREIDRDTNVLPYVIPEFDEGILSDVDESQGVITGYKTVSKTEDYIAENQYYPYYEYWSGELVFFEASSAVNSTDAASNNAGTGGSMARFTLYGNYLYAIDNYQLKIFNIESIENPQFIKEEYIGWNIETLFPYQNKLFIGSMSGMYVYDLSIPTNPQYISMFSHAMACDPVVVEGDYAYVTLRAGNICGAEISELDVIDISNLADTKLIKNYPMEEPYGLGIDSTTLFVCDGNAGLKIYNASDPMTIDSNLIITYPHVNTFDVIPLGNVLLMIGSDGLYQYDYSDVKNIKQLSQIPIYQ